MFFLGSLSIHCKSRCDQWINHNTWRSTCWPPMVYFSV